jgi:hypothetical protein
MAMKPPKKIRIICQLAGLFILFIRVDPEIYKPWNIISSY